MENKEHIVSYKTYGLILIILIALTLTSVALTHIEFNEYTLSVALILASIKSCIVLLYFMHLKFENRIYIYMILGIITIIVSVLGISFLDYSYR